MFDTLKNPAYPMLYSTMTYITTCHCFDLRLFLNTVQFQLPIDNQDMFLQGWEHVPTRIRDDTDKIWKRYRLYMQYSPSPPSPPSPPPPGWYWQEEKEASHFFLAHCVSKFPLGRGKKPRDKSEMLNSIHSRWREREREEVLAGRMGIGHCLLKSLRHCSLIL